MATETAGTVANGIDCVCYLAKDFSRATSFYETRLGLKPSRGAESWVEYDLSDGTTFSIVQLPEGAWYQTGGAMFAVPDVPAAVAALRAAGTTIHGDVYDSPVCTMAWCDDTEGNNFAVHKRK
ncbi:MAG TPA: VOC family protein [Candidatus Baltobacteraceae bacterium]|jgi:predicted enzyme related to lactoylglutathione lyase|nr:VOC family protein [Candidatus Baltobacteraceae bacterium]